jgi:hypothetical protein
MGQQEGALVEGAGNVAMLEDNGASEETGWLRCCSSLPEETGGSAGTNIMVEDDPGWCFA